MDYREPQKGVVRIDGCSKMSFGVCDCLREYDCFSCEIYRKYWDSVKRLDGNQHSVPQELESQ